jgi:hypothetical protein
MKKHMKDVDLINEAYTAKVQRIDEYGQLVAQGLKALGPKVAGKIPQMAGSGTMAKIVNNDKVRGAVGNFAADKAGEKVDQMISDDSLDDDNVTDLEPGENISRIGKENMIKTIIDSLEELIKGNTGPDSPCGEKEALELIGDHCGSRLHQMKESPALIGALAPAAVDLVGKGIGAIAGGGDK